MKQKSCNCSLLLIWLLALSSVLSDVIVNYKDDSMSFSSAEASFGPKLSSQGYSGVLIVAQPHDACSKIQPLPQNSSSASVALIARFASKDCDFGTKVHAP